MESTNTRIRQLLLLAAIIGLALLLFKELYAFFPGFLGAITWYILCRDFYSYLTEKKGWKKGLTAVLFLLGFLVCAGLPVYLGVRLMTARLNSVFADTQEVMQVLRTFSGKIKEWTGQDLLTDANIGQLQKAVTGFIPTLLNSTAAMLGNLIMLLFLVFFMFTSRKGMEKGLTRWIPLRDDNIGILAKETKSIVRANAIGIPLISLIQGVAALLGYWIFGVKDFVLWGFLTGLFAFFPVVGTMVIWVPVVVYVFSAGHTGQGIGLLIYSVVVTGNIDTVARITILRGIGDVHPLVTVLGVIVGLKLFGFWGFIFGPLLVSYFLLLYKIYCSEYGALHKPSASASKAEGSGG
ncbi:MAG: AI-2E family transporter [Bacteroidetes bacterium]|nr:AI-2E family transporter [Bacteroidota bacterium]